MNYWLAQLILAARNSDRDGGWSRILVFVVLAIFYAVGSIIKAKANKSAQKEEKQIPRKPLTKPSEGAREFKHPSRPARPAPSIQPQPQAVKPQVTKPQVAKPQVQPPRRKIIRPATGRSAVTRPRPVVGRKVPTRVEEAIDLPTLEPTLEELPELTTEYIKELKAERVAKPAETPQSKYLSEILLDYDDPEKLRRAILHYEILGKPLSLREPSEQIK